MSEGQTLLIVGLSLPDLHPLIKWFSLQIEKCHLSLVCENIRPRKFLF